jgi:hypothetical protein
MEYLSKYPDSRDASTLDYRVGGYDVLDIVVYEEEDLSRKNVPLCANEGETHTP